MLAEDLPGVDAVAAIVHPGFPEDGEVLAERLALHPAGCFALDGEAGIAGYLISHPWHDNAAPKLNSRLGAIPADAETYYIHDLALHPAAQGTGAAGAIIRRLMAETAAFPRHALVAVNGSAPFWSRFGFSPAEGPDLASYGGAAIYMVRAGV